MTTAQLTGDIHLALSHLALVGVAVIVDDARSGSGHPPSRLWWSEDLQPVPMLSCGLGLGEIAAVVHAHASARTGADVWLNRTESEGARAGGRLFAARAKVPKPGEWSSSVAARRAARPSAARRSLDGRLIAGLGEAAWWRWAQNANRPDQGASRWEMKTRNRGEEFLRHRLGPLAQAVSGRRVESVVNGLSGAVVTDELSGTSPDSRTSTGLTTPGPVDSVIAWCALWGISVVPTVAQLGAVSRTPGMWPRDRLYPTCAGFPVFADPVTAVRVSQVLSSRAFDVFGSAHAGAQTGQTSASAETVEIEAARAWLVEQGVRAMVYFPVIKTGSASAPERQLLAGELVVLA